MKNVLLSIRPEWVEKIVSGEKTIEVRKTAPKEVPFRVFIYETYAKSKWRYSSYEGAYENSKGELVYAQGKVIGDFICDRVEKFDVPYPAWDKAYLKDIIKNSCLSYNDLHSYIGSGNSGYAWHISDLKIYDKPRELSEFCSPREVSAKYYRNEMGQTVLRINVGGDLLKRPPQSWYYVEEL